MAALAAILLVGMGWQWVAWRVKLPAILFLLLCGILAGPVLDVLHPDQLFGPLLLAIDPGGRIHKIASERRQVYEIQASVMLHQRSHQAG